MSIRVCPQCGAGFIPASHRDKYCSPVCRERRRRIGSPSTADATPVTCPDCGQIVVHDADADEQLQKLAFVNHERYCRPSGATCDICREVQVLHDAGETDIAVYLAHLPSLRSAEALRRHLIDHGNPLAAVRLGLQHITTRPAAQAGKPPEGEHTMNLHAVPKASDTGRPDAATLTEHADTRIAKAARKVLEAEDRLTAVWEQYAAKAQLRAKRDKLRKQLADIEAQLKGGAAAAPTVDTKAVRAWALENGYQVSPAGIVPKAIVQAYLDATGGAA